MLTIVAAGEHEISRRIEAALARERKRAGERRIPLAAGRLLDGPVGDRLSAVLSGARRAYRRLRARVGLPV